MPQTFAGKSCKKLNIREENRHMSKKIPNFVYSEKLHLNLKPMDMAKRLRQVLPVLMLLFSLATAYGQTGTITGVVRDARTGETLPGANVIIRGTTTGTVTGIDGDYTLEVPAGSVTLDASFIGYEPVSRTVTVSAGARLALNFELSSDVAMLEEIVVIGYGVMRKSDLTGSVTNVRADEMNRGVLTDPIQGLQGKSAGVMITKRGGDPNAGFSVKIRGAFSLATGTSLLYVVDGIPGVDPTTIAPEDIESFNILKDASAAAIYGSRGANGVIIITTRRGTDRRGAGIEFSSYVSTETVANRLDLLSGDQIRDFASQTGRSFLDGGDNVDWQDQLYRTGSSRNYNLAFTGQEGSLSYRASVGHNIFDGVVMGSRKERTIARLNIDQKALNDRLTLSAGIAGTFEDNKYINYGGWGLNDVFYQTFRRNPTDPVFDEEGNYYEMNRGFNYKNPLATIEEIQNERDAKRYFGYLKADLEVFDGLTAGINLGYTRDDSESFYFEPALSTSVLQTQGFGNRAYNNHESKVLETTLRYANSFDRHSIEAVGGYSFQEDFNTGLFAQGRQPFINYSGAYNLGLLQSVTEGRDIGSHKSSSRLISFFGRAIYNYDSKYFLTATLRRDGSSRFGINNEWGWFPSASAMWNISRESFMQDQTVVSNLRLRAGYGITGNQEIGNYNDIEYYIAAGNTINFETGDEAILFEFAHAANPDLKWEENHEINLGLDFGLFDDKISGSFDFYRKNTKDLLGSYSVPVPPYPVGRIWANVGEIQVQGFEFNIQAYPVRTSRLDWRTVVVFSTYKQDVISLSNDQFEWSRLQEGYLSGPGLVGGQNWTQTVQPGMSLGTWYMPEYAGLINGEFAFFTAAGGVTRQLDLAERRVVGKAQPDFEIGWSNFFTLFGNLDASLTLRGVYGYQMFNTTKLIFGNPTLLPESNVLQFALEEYERGLRDNPKPSSYYLEDASFLRIDNISLGYNFRDLAGMRNVRVYLAANNVFTFTNYSGIDPEISFDGLSFGIDQYNIYPKTRTLTLGVNVSL